MDSKYGSLWGRWCSLELAGSFGLGLWKNIRKGWEKFSCFTRFEVRDGSKISFWHDQWCEDAALKVAFPVLYGLACAKGAFVVADLEFLGGSNQWNVSFASMIKRMFRSVVAFSYIIFPGVAFSQSETRV